MRAFNLKDFLANPKQNVTTLFNEKVEILCTDRNNADKPIVFILRSGSDSGSVYYADVNGRYKGAHQLFFAPTKKTGWINIYKEDDFFHASSDIIASTGCYVFDTEEHAKTTFNTKIHLATVKIEWEEN